MKKIFFVMWLAATAANAEWKLVWSDEFNYTGHPDPAKWSNEHGFKRNNEAQFYTTNRLENARVENGCLVLEARKEDWSEGKRSAKYTSASLITKGKASWKFGRVEVRAKLPVARGAWPAIWMLGENHNGKGWPDCGEIDIMEAVGHITNKVFGTVHAGPKTDHSRGSKIDIPDLGADFHVFALEWSEGRMELSVDEKKYLTVEKDADKKSLPDWPFDAPEYLLLNIAIGGHWGGQKGIDDSAFPQKMLVDYVRIYQRQ
jgi:beta-glucanase (GH16 family)